MSIVLQLVVIFLVGLIAYWWANQGFFSSLLHFVAVVCAGALALAFWEPLVQGVLLKNTFFDNYAWGMALVFLFLAALVIIRVSFDKLAPANVQIPQWANQVFGGLFGVGSGVITIGILLIGIGYTQSTVEILGMKFLARENRGITTDHEGEQYLWVPVHQWTAVFYEYLSVGSLQPDFVGRPLALANPRVDQQAYSLIRDSYRDGTARISIPPDAVTILGVSQTPDRSRYYVDFRVTNEAYDHSEQFVCSSAQIRLLSFPDQQGRKGPVSIAHPDRWKQAVRAQEGARRYVFDDVSHYLTSIPGQAQATFQVEFTVGPGEFQVAPGYFPKFIQIKGTRFELPSVASWDTISEGTADLPLAGRSSPPDTSGAREAARGDIARREDIRPINTSINSLLGWEVTDGRLLVEGEQTFRVGERSGNRETRIRGIYATPGTQIVQVDVSRSSTAGMYPVRDQVGNDAAPVLIDSQGREYYAKGYLLETPHDFYLWIRPNQLIRSVGSLPHLPTSDVNKMRLIYEVTEGATIVAFRIGDRTVATTSLLVQP